MRRWPHSLSGHGAREPAPGESDGVVSLVGNLVETPSIRTNTPSEHTTLG